MQETTLVLGGGGLSGIAWMTGLIAGLADLGIDLTGPARIIGTSAGAAVGAQIGSGIAPAELYARQVDAAKQVAEISPDPGQMAELMSAFAALAGVSDPGERNRRIGRLALEARTVTEAARRAVISARLPSHDWPARPLSLTAIDAGSGTFRVFDASSGVSLVDAVAASCAVPGVWPPVSIGGRRYVDGGMRSAENADLAAGARSVLILSPMGRAGLPGGSPTLPREIAGLEAAGTQVHVVEPDAEVRAAIGVNALDPAIRAPTAEAGRRQAGAAAPALRTFLAA